MNVVVGIILILAAIAVHYGHLDVVLLVLGILTLLGWAYDAYHD